jgi:hypothetical protein
MMYKELAGIQAASPGFKTINIRPLILNGAGISNVAATYKSEWRMGSGLEN